MDTSPSAPSFEVESRSRGTEQSPRARKRLEPGWQVALWSLATLEIGLSLVGVYSVRLVAPPVNGPSSLDLPVHNLWDQYLSIWQRWDARWYQDIAQNGYHAGDGTVHFQPLYPLLSRATAPILGGQIVPAMLAVSAAAFLVAMWLLYRTVRLDAGPGTARLTVLLMALFPTGFFLLAPYTESLFLASSVAAFWFARQGRPWLGGLAGAGAVLARTFGIILVLPLAFEYLRQRDQKGKHPGFGLLAATLPAMALIVQSVYDRLIVGERQSVFQLAAAWGDRIVPPWRALPDSVSHIARAGDGVELLNLLCLVGFALLAIACVRRLPLLYGLFVVPYLGLMFSRESMVSPLESVCRYVLVLFPCFIILAMWLAKRPRLAVSALVVGGMLQAMLFQYWVHWGFVA